MSLIVRLSLICGLLIAGGMIKAAESELNTLAPKAHLRLLMDITAVTEQRIVAVGERGHILVSTDSGENWRQILVPTDALLTRVLFLDDQIGFAVGHNQVIFKTTDAGESWQLQHENDDLEQPALLDIWFKNSKQGIAIGSYGLYLSTEDGGATWEPVNLESLEDPEIGFPHFYSIAFEEKSQKLFMAGELGFLAESDDLGKTWQKLETPYNGSFFNIVALPNGYLVAVGLRGHIFRSTDLAQSWQSIDSGTISGLQRSILLPNNKLLIVGSDGTQLLSNDFAKSVKLFQRSDRVHLAGAMALPSQQVLLVGVNGVLKATQIQ